MKRHLILAVLALMLLPTTALAQYPYSWTVGGSVGMGAVYSPNIAGSSYETIGLTIAYNKVIANTRWRWGAETGLLSDCFERRFKDDDPDFYLRPSLYYAGAPIDFSVVSGKRFALYARAGIAASDKVDRYRLHSDHKLTALGIAGIGADFNFGRFIVCGYITPDGTASLMGFFGWYFYKKQRN